tara:strand:+ start:680 stop:1720 length:1041 start_codon:yes stop_codon:yes gene_type:complete
MTIFFNTFFKVLGTLLALATFIGILSAFLVFFEGNSSLSDFRLIEGDKASKNKIAIIKLYGPIIDQKISFNSISGIQTINPDNFKKKLKNLDQINPNVLIISINSPGGTVSASYEMYRLLNNYIKQSNNLDVYFHTSETLASGAYWFALASDKIYASYGSLIGSIGVKGPDWIYYDEPIAISSGIFGNSIETKKGIKVYSQNAGKSKDILNPFRKPTVEELSKLNKMIEDIYRDFVLTVSKKRKIEINIIKNQIGALIYNSSGAKENYLINDVVDFDSLIKKIIKDKQYLNYQIYENSDQNLSLLNKYFFNLFENKNDINASSKDIICNQFITNISSITNSYILNC